MATGPFSNRQSCNFLQETRATTQMKVEACTNPLVSHGETRSCHRNEERKQLCVDCVAVCWISFVLFRWVHLTAPFTRRLIFVFGRLLPTKVDGTNIWAKLLQAMGEEATLTKQLEVSLVIRNAKRFLKISSG